MNINHVKDVVGESRSSRGRCCDSRKICTASNIATNTEEKSGTWVSISESHETSNVSKIDVKPWILLLKLI